MRITQSYTDRKYLKNNNRVLTNQTHSMQKIWSQMDYFRASENSINASKAMVVRKSLQDIGMYQANLKSSQGLYKAAEKDLYTIANKIYIEASTKLDQACNGTYSQSELDDIALDLDHFAEQALTTMNGDYAERKIFGGTNNSSPAFATLKEDDGITDKLDPVTGHKIVTYNGIIVEDISADGKLYRNRTDKDAYDAAVAAGDDTVMRVAYDRGYDTEIDEATYNTIAAADPESVRDEMREVKTEISAADYDAITDPAEKAKYTEETNKAGEKIYTKTEEQHKYYQTNYRYFTREAATKDDYDKSNFDGTILKETSEIAGSEITEADYGLLTDDEKAQYIEKIDAAGTKTYVKTEDKYYKLYTEKVPGTDPIYVDVGLGIKYNKDGEVQIGTAIDINMNGAKITGTGFRTNEKVVNSKYIESDPFSEKSYDMQFSNNFVQLLYDAADALRGGDISRANATIDLLNNANNGILTEITSLGAEQRATEFYLDKDEEYETTLKERQNEVEGVDMKTEITNLDAMEAAYNALLQLSSRVLPKSIFDFI